MSATKRWFHTAQFLPPDEVNLTPTSVEDCCALLALVTDVPSLNWDSHKDKLEVYKQGPADETCDNPFKLATIKDENTALYSNLSRFSNEVVSMYKAAHTAQSFILVQLSQGPTDLDSPPDEHCFELF